MTTATYDVCADAGAVARDALVEMYRRRVIFHRNSLRHERATAARRQQALDAMLTRPDPDPKTVDELICCRDSMREAAAFSEDLLNQAAAALIDLAPDQWHKLVPGYRRRRTAPVRKAAP